MSSADDLPTFGRLVKARRQAARLSLERLAELCGVSSSTIKHVAKGRASAPTFSPLLALTRYLDPPYSLKECDARLP